MPVLLLALGFILPACENIEFNYGRPNCRDGSYGSWSVSITRQNIDGFNIYHDINQGYSVISFVQNLANVCPGDSLTLEVALVWDAACPQPAYFGAAVDYNQETLASVPLDETFGDNRIRMEGSVTAIAPEGESGTEFVVVFEAMFDGEDPIASRNLFLQYLVSLDLTLHYTKLP